MTKDTLVEIVTMEYKSSRDEIILHLRYNYITIGVMVGYATSIAGLYASESGSVFVNDFGNYAAIPYFAISIVFYMQLIYVARLAKYIHSELNKRLGSTNGLCHPAFGWEKYIKHSRQAGGAWALKFANLVFKAIVTLVFPSLIFIYWRLLNTELDSDGHLDLCIRFSDVLNSLFSLYVLYLMIHTAFLFRVIADDN